MGSTEGLTGGDRISGDGVENVETQLAQGEIWVEVSDGTTLSEETVREIIRNAGFTLSGFAQHQYGEGG